MSSDAAKRLGAKPLARIVGYATASLEPVWFTIAPVDAIRKLLQKTGIAKEKVGLFEINEAFAGVTIAAIRGLSLDPESVNVNGGAVALGHPVGCSGRGSSPRSCTRWPTGESGTESPPFASAGERPSP